MLGGKPTIRVGLCKCTHIPTVITMWLLYHATFVHKGLRLFWSTLPAASLEAHERGDRRTQVRRRAAGSARREAVDSAPDCWRRI